MKKVYQAVLRIPLGQTRTYKWVAQQIGKPKAVRAVGQALKKNPWTIFIPCHRVVASSGKLGGYSKGAKVKRRLLGLERQIRELVL